MLKIERTPYDQIIDLKTNTELEEGVKLSRYSLKGEVYYNINLYHGDEVTPSIVSVKEDDLLTLMDTVMNNKNTRETCKSIFSKDSRTIH